MNPMWLVRMSRWVRNPPSPARVKLVVGVVVVALIILGLEHAGFWPDALTTERVRLR